ncbi:MAG TPA: hypothetical protein VFS19_05315 [Planctomycetota bacterium]|nr:hypothetical protein [Planctomycetota bacterium]
MKPGTGGLGLTLLGIAGLVVLLLLIVRRGPMGGLMVILGIAVAIFVVSMATALMGKRKKNG